MRTLNNIRKTNAFNVTGTEVEMMAAILQHFADRGWAVVGIANDPENVCQYTVRAYLRTLGSCYDFVAERLGTVRVIECELITGAPLSDVMDRVNQKPGAAGGCFNRLS